MSIRWGFLGAGWIAQQAMAQAVHGASNSKLYAVASQERTRSATLEPEVVYDSYQDILDDPKVDAVYICLANHQHLEWVTRALVAGKPVLCEKPLGLTAAEAAQLAGLAEASGLLLVEAVWARWHPRFRRLAHLATSGELGEILSIDSTFTFPASLEGNYRSNPRMGGGALLDVGCYQIHAQVAITSSTAPYRVTSVERTISPGGIDLTTRASLTIGESTIADSLASFEMDEGQTLSVIGSLRTARTLDGPAFTTWRDPASLLIDTMVERFEAVDAYQLMIENVSEHITTGAGYLVPIADSIRVAEILDDIAAKPASGGRGEIQPRNAGTMRSPASRI